MVQVATVDFLMVATVAVVVVPVVVLVDRADHHPATLARPAVETTVDAEGIIFPVLLLPQV
jgi:hypothetical protein